MTDPVSLSTRETRFLHLWSPTAWPYRGNEVSGDVVIEAPVVTVQLRLTGAAHGGDGGVVPCVMPLPAAQRELQGVRRSFASELPLYFPKFKAILPKPGFCSIIQTI